MTAYKRKVVNTVLGPYETWEPVDDPQPTTRIRPETIVEFPRERQMSALVPVERPQAPALPAEMRPLQELMEANPLAAFRFLEDLLHEHNHLMLYGKPFGGFRTHLANFKDSRTLLKVYHQVKQHLIACYGAAAIAQATALRDMAIDRVQEPMRQVQRDRYRDEMTWQAEHRNRYDPQLVSQRETQAHERAMRRFDAWEAERMDMRQLHARLDDENRRRPTTILRERMDAAREAQETIEQLQHEPNEEMRRRLEKVARAAMRKALEGEI